MVELFAHTAWLKSASQLVIEMASRACFEKCHRFFLEFRMLIYIALLLKGKHKGGIFLISSLASNQDDNQVKHFAFI